MDMLASGYAILEIQPVVIFVQGIVRHDDFPAFGDGYGDLVIQFTLLSTLVATYPQLTRNLIRRNKKSSELPILNVTQIIFLQRLDIISL